ncbi:MAG: DUF5320 domain-containing protein [Bacteroidetes bacterium]|nr:DUF5320 domain-containing protein [Bacteroidota bacterium]MBU1115893.1 DUF5320 domain-containing protein [Bacteroidota bacterium]MBU1798748.1 DUF5320 domain-containing protein [Bacteroidota bacterium]
MPNRNQMGPSGMGPMTGRGMGIQERRGFNRGFNSGYGRGCGYGRGNGFGRGFGFGYGMQLNSNANNANLSQKEFLENELKIMKEQVVRLEEQLGEV